MKTILTSLAVIMCMITYAQNDVINKTNLYTGQQEKLEVIEEGLVEYTRYYDNGTIEETGFVLNGEKHGLWQRFTQNGGKQSEMSYNEGQREGMKYVWNEEGHLIFKVKYEADAVVEAIHYADNGSIIAAR